MSLHVALLRGINVGGHGKLPMAALRALMAELGCRDVVTYIASGNVVFAHSAPEGLAGRLTAAIKAAHGFAPRVLVLSGDVFREIAAACPYPDDPHVFFLAEPPTEPDTASMDAARAPTESYELTDRALYLHAPGGLGRSKLAGRIERALGVPATARNGRTVAKLLALLDRASG